jgi:[ribosomal protein S18]-alanine N-acetyltransferase
MTPARRSHAPRFAIRPGVAADLLRLVEIENGAFAGDRLSRRALARHLRSPTAALLVAAEPPDRVVAYALLLLRANARRARLYSLAVDPHARGLGLARSLIAAAEAEALRRGASALTLEVRVDNAAAIRLYEALGYRGLGRRSDYYEDGADALHYEKPLEPARPRQNS